MPLPRIDEAFVIEFIRTIINGDNSQVAQLLSAHPRLIHAGLHTEFFSEEIMHQLYTGDTGLHVAAAAFNVEIAATLISKGADIHAKNRRGAEALHYASDSGPMKSTWNTEAQKDVINFLIQSGANLNAVDKCGASPLHRAVRTRSTEAVGALLAGGAEVRIKNHNGSTPLHLAVQNTGKGGTGAPESKAHQAKIIELLLESGADPEDQDFKGRTVKQWIREKSIKSLFPGGD